MTLTPRDFPNRFEPRQDDFLCRSYRSILPPIHYAIAQAGVDGSGGANSTTVLILVGFSGFVNRNTERVPFFTTIHSDDPIVVRPITMFLYVPRGGRWLGLAL